MESVFIIGFLLFMTCSLWGPWFESKPPVDNRPVAKKVDVVEVRRLRDELLNRLRNPVQDIPPKPVESIEKIIPEQIDCDMPKNIAKNPRDITWFQCTRTDLPEPSVAEYRIIAALKEYHVEWYREVSFRGLQFTTYSWPRYDFYIPAYRIIIEYDGEAYHNSKDRKQIDNAKDRFCKQNGITVHRYNKKHYYHLMRHIDDLMVSIGVQKKRGTV